MMLCLSSCDNEDDPEINIRKRRFVGINILMKVRTKYSEFSNSFQGYVTGGKLKIVILESGLSESNMGKRGIQ
jgi:hypothetical protein